MSTGNQAAQSIQAPRASWLATVVCVLGFAAVFPVVFVAGIVLKLLLAGACVVAFCALSGPQALRSAAVRRARFCALGVLLFGTFFASFFLEFTLYCAATILLGAGALVHICVSGGLRTGAVRASIGMLVAAALLIQGTRTLGPHTEERLANRSARRLQAIAHSTYVWFTEKGDGRFFPPTLKALVEDGIVTDTHIFAHPKSDRAGSGTRGAVSASFVSDYESLMDRAGYQIRQEDVPSNLMMIWEKEALFSFNDEPFRNVAFADTHTERVPETEFKKLLAEVDHWISEHKPNGGEPDPHAESD